MKVKVNKVWRFLDSSYQVCLSIEHGPKPGPSYGRMIHTKTAIPLFTFTFHLHHPLTIFGCTRLIETAGACESREMALTLAELSPSESVCRTFMEASAKYLYDVKAYDSDLELEDIGCDAIDVPEVESVTVYGKIPTKSVAIPTIMGGTYSPDFMYVVKRKGVREELNVVIEVKDVEKDADLHKSEDMKIKCAEVFYNMLRDDGIDVRYQRQLKNQK